MKKFMIVILILGGHAVSGQGVDLPPEYPDEIHGKGHSAGKNFIPYVHLREADVTWQKRVWRTIDVREKANLPFYFPKTDLVNRKSMIQVVTKSILAGKIIAFSDEEFLERISTEDFRKLFVIPGSVVETEVYDSTGAAKTVTVMSAADSTWFYENFCSIQLKEDWFFDRQRSVLEVRIIGLGFSFLPRAKEDAGCQTYFYVYFPACRPQFARHEVFNVKNDSERRTFDDIFWKRQFSSVITKESNVYDRQIRDYARGLDALLESDRVKGDIFRLEHDLWQF